MGRRKMNYVKNNKFESIMGVILCGFILFNIQDFAKVTVYYPYNEWFTNLVIQPVEGTIFLVLFQIIYIVGRAKIESKKQKSLEE